MTRQEIFDTVSRRLIIQRQPALGNFHHCRYRAEDGLKCAVGHLIPDDKYDSSIEGFGITSSGLAADMLRAALPFVVTDEVRQLLSNLQHAHDIVLKNSGITGWRERMIVIANENNLEHKFINLSMLADYLLSLPEDYKAFDMSDFFQGDDEARYARENGGVGKCGAVACAVGHGPSAGMLAIDSDFTDRGTMMWWKYTERLFLKIASGTDFNWMFGGGWYYCDNTPQGAAKRILYYIDKGVPDNFRGPSSDYLELYASCA